VKKKLPHRVASSNREILIDVDLDRVEETNTNRVFWVHRVAPSRTMRLRLKSRPRPLRATSRAPRRAARARHVTRTTTTSTTRSGPSSDAPPSSDDEPAPARREAVRR